MARSRCCCGRADRADRGRCRHRRPCHASELLRARRDDRATGAARRSPGAGADELACASGARERHAASGHRYGPALLTVSQPSMSGLLAALWVHPSPHRGPHRTCDTGTADGRGRQFGVPSDEIGGFGEGQRGLPVWPLARGAPALPARHRLQSLSGILMPAFPPCGGCRGRAVFVVGARSPPRHEPKPALTAWSAYEVIVTRHPVPGQTTEPTRRPGPYG